MKKLKQIFGKNKQKKNVELEGRESPELACEKDKEFQIHIDKRYGTALGISTVRVEGNMLRVESVKVGLVEQWNRINPDRVVRPGDFIIAVNGISKDCELMLDECSKRQQLTCTFLRREIAETEDASSITNVLSLLTQAQHLSVTIYGASKLSAAEYSITLDRSQGGEIGMHATSHDDGALLVQSIHAGLLQKWNSENPHEKVNPGDIIIEVNCVRHTCKDMLLELNRDRTLELKLLRRLLFQDNGLETKTSLYCRCEALPKSLRLKFKTHCAAYVSDPVWNYHKQLSLHDNIEALRFSIWSKDSEYTRALGRATLRRSKFSEHGFEGALILKESFKDALSSVNVKVGICIESTYTFDRTSGESLGIDYSLRDAQGLRITAIRQGAMQVWNQNNFLHAVKTGDVIVKVNDIGGDNATLARELGKSIMLQIKIVRMSMRSKVGQCLPPSSCNTAALPRSRPASSALQHVGLAPMDLAEEVSEIFRQPEAFDTTATPQPKSLARVVASASGNRKQCTSTNEKRRVLVKIIGVKGLPPDEGHGREDISQHPRMSCSCETLPRYDGLSFTTLLVDRMSCEWNYVSELLLPSDVHYLKFVLWGRASLGIGLLPCTSFLAKGFQGDVTLEDSGFDSALALVLHVDVMSQSQRLRDNVLDVPHPSVEPASFFSRTRMTNPEEEFPTLRVTIIGTHGFRQADWPGESGMYCSCSRGWILQTSATSEATWNYSAEVLFDEKIEALKFIIKDDDIIYGTATLERARFELAGFDGMLALSEIENSSATLRLRVGVKPTFENAKGAQSATRQRALRVEILAARGLRVTHGKPDAKFSCSCIWPKSNGIQDMTPMIRGALNPAWNHAMSFPLDEAFDAVHFSVFQGGLQNPVGQTSLSRKAFLSGGFEGPLMLHGCRNSIQPTLNVKMEVCAPTAAPKDTRAVMVTLIDAQGIPAKMGQSCFCRCEAFPKIDGVSFDTEPAILSLLVWNHRCILRVDDRVASLDFLLLDCCTNETLCRATLPCSAFATVPFDGKLRLKGIEGDVALRMKAEIVSDAIEAVESQRTLLWKEAGRHQPLWVKICSAQGIDEIVPTHMGASISCVGRVIGRSRSRFQTMEELAIKPRWNHLHEIKDYVIGDSLHFEVIDKEFGSLGIATLVCERFLPHGCNNVLPLLHNCKQTKALLTIEVIVPLQSLAFDEHIESLRCEDDPDGVWTRPAKHNESTLYGILASSDGMLKLWDFMKMECVDTVQAHGGAVTAVSADFWAMLAVSSGDDGLICVWDLNLVFQGVGPVQSRGQISCPSAVTCLVADFVTCRAITASDDCDIRIWNLESMSFSASVTGHVGGTACLRIDFARNRGLSCGCQDNMLRMWDLTQQASAAVFQVEGCASCLDVDFLLQRAVWGSHDGVLHLLDLEIWVRMATLECIEGPVRAVVADFVTQRMWTCSGQTLQVWDLGMLVCVRKLHGHSQLISSLAVASSIEWAASVASGGEIILWDLDAEVYDRSVKATDENGIRSGTVLCIGSSDYDGCSTRQSHHEQLWI